ncbi:MAG: transcription-repair coupling factor [Alphaproteobacteria bacterium]
MTSEPFKQSNTINHRILSGLPASAEGLAIAELMAGKYGDAPSSLVHVAVNDRSLSTLAASLEFFAPDLKVLHFPAWDCMPYDRVSPHASLMAERMQVLSQLADGSVKKPFVILTTVSAAIQKLPPKSLMRAVTLHIKQSQHISQDRIVAFLATAGYRRVGKAIEPGEFALRGSIMDIVPPALGEGLRLDWFGDEIESIRRYDLLSQITTTNTESVALHPVSEVILNDDTVRLFRENYREMFGAISKEDPLYEAVSSLHNYPGVEHWLPLFYSETQTILDYCQSAAISMDMEASKTLEERHESIRDYYNARVEALSMSSKKTSFAAGAVYHPIQPELGFVMEKEWQSITLKNSCIQFDTFNTPDNTPLFRSAIRFTQNQPDYTPFDQLKERVSNASEQGKNVLLACFTSGSRERLQTLLSERGFHVVRIESWKDKKDVRGKTIGLAVLPLENGFETESTLILSEQDVLGERIARSKTPKRKSEVFLQEASNFNEGELLVHKEHGIGRFEGLVAITVSGAAHDCLKLIYDGGDKLFLPVENIDLVSKFGMDEEDAKLDKLGGASWQARKAKLKEKILIAAEALLKIAAERQIKPGVVIDTPAGTYDDFVSRFPYAETEDQDRAISETLEDLHSGKPMDRLICGDVGFGKTEVALRAAFVAAMGDSAAKMQVAVITPTTLLARQHYKNFSKRFEGFPVKIRQLSRMVPAKEQKETKEQLASGEVDIVIGTHALLSKQVQFKNLGLVIVDEEQHFGVGQKEKLKELKSNVHVLTLSATPIPRTLQMALTGVRDLSLITTPPVDRLAIRSFVMPFDPVVIREAVLREMHRGGQTFLVTPRIKDIAELKVHMKEIVPEARIAVGHGQMPAAELDQVMNDFYDGKYDILLSTAIIESGLDIPTANTMIIHKAHLFGLAQLYQMRGRVGRGKLRAYAYFLLPHHKLLTKNATRRLEVMSTLDTLGAGFTLASHDMDIRGFGNLVGEEQSGHIREVGVELYQQMLEEAVASLKNNVILSKAKDLKDSSAMPQNDSTDWSPQINLGLSVLIPETYIEDLSLRLGLYRRAADLKTADDISAFASELVDRFGDMPEETKTLIATLDLKTLCKKAGIDRIDTGPKGAVFSFHNNTFSNPDALLTYIAKNVRNLKARPDQKVVFTHEWKPSDDKIGLVKKIIGDIAGFANR